MGPIATAPSASAPGLDQPWPLLGGLSAQTFMRKYWQKKPLLIRQAIAGVVSPVNRAEMFELAGRDDVESRLVVQGAPSKGKKAAPEWALHHGPITRARIPKLNQPRWTLLVQGLDLHVPAAHELIKQFRFVPDARLDDLMISYASDGGGVGPHYDSYDVFLLQVHGTRRWRIGPIKDASLLPDMPVKILANFEPEEEYVLEPGDMLYLRRVGSAVAEDAADAVGDWRSIATPEDAGAVVCRPQAGCDGTMWRDSGIARICPQGAEGCLARPAGLAPSVG